MASILSDSTNSQQQQDAGSLIRQAYTYLISNQPGEAIALYKKCITQHPKCWRAYQNLGVAYINVKDFQNAYEVLKVYVQHVPKDPLGHDSLGVSYSQLNDPLQAIASFVNSINLAPSYYMSYYNLGVVLGKLGLYQYALNVYKRSLQLQPNYINAMNNIGDIYKRFNDIDAAIQIFKQLLEINPNYTLGIKNLGNCYFAKKQYLLALNMYLRFLGINPNSDSVICNISLCLDHFGLYGTAAQCLKTAYDLVGKQNSQSLTRLFITGNLYSKQFTQINKIMRTMVQFGFQPTSAIKQSFYAAYMKTLQTFDQLSSIIPDCRETVQNIKRLKLNLIGFEAKMGHAFQLLKQQNLNLKIQTKILDKIQQQKLIVKQILKWRKYLKTIIKKHPKPPLTLIQQKFKHQKQQVHKIFDKPLYQIDKQTIKTYISRRYCHNLKRLIMKRRKFISKYNKFNYEFQRVFKYRPMLKTFSFRSSTLQQNSKQSEERSSSEEIRLNLEVIDENQIEGNNQQNNRGIGIN